MPKYLYVMGESAISPRKGPQEVNELLNIATYKLTNRVHFDGRWRAKKKVQTFHTAIAELIIGGAQVTGSTSASLQRSYKEDEM